MTKIPMPGQPVRGSRSGAPIMALFDLLGRHWAMGVLWTLSEVGPCTFRKLQEECETISPAALNTRLKELQAAGFVHRVEGGYATTDLGQHLYGHLCPLGDFSKEWAKHMIIQE
ncbi:MAG: helix-turn-helix transcriptional regulator [Sneathiellales bacterium]|nr:helix-turn-helix transcriptional regulator [Sneathiellales bacterium]